MLEDARMARNKSVIDLLDAWAGGGGKVLADQHG